MRRYDGRCLGDNPYIVVLGSCKVGNFIVTIPLLRSLRRKYPKSTIVFWGSEITKELEQELTKDRRDSKKLLDKRVSWDLQDENRFEEISREIKNSINPDLVINCDGFNPITKVIAAWMSPKWVVGGCLSKNLRREMDTGEMPNNKILEERGWDSIEFAEKYKDIMDSQYIAKILCTLSFMNPNEEDLNIELPRKDANIDVPELLIHCTASRSAKQWSVQGWLEVLEWCYRQDIKVGIIGASPKIQTEEYNSGNIESALIDMYGEKGKNGKNNLIDLRGKTSLIELAGVCSEAKGVISVDAGPLHIAAAVGVPVMAIVGNDRDGTGASPIRLWMPRSSNVTRTISEYSCDQCSINHFKNDTCIAEKHFCMEGVRSKEITDWIGSILKKEQSI